MNTTLHDGIILASESPRRKDLLQRMGLEFTVIPSGLVEMPPMGDSPCAYVSRMAMEKAVHVGQSYPTHVVIGADTIVVCEGHIMGKPGSVKEASLMLSRLANKWHEVWTGLCVTVRNQHVEIVKAIRSRVCFRDLSLADIETYVATGEPMDKAGAYAIQGKGGALVKSIEGSFHNIIGLPTLELGKILLDLGVLKEEPQLGCDPLFRQS